MNERLLHILDETACLTRRQMKDYLSGNMLPEEIHAAEAHIASCPLCNMAVEGFEVHGDEAQEAINSLNSSFLKAHFDSITPQIHLNSLSPATVVSRPKKKAKTVSLLPMTGIAAALLLAAGLFWYLKGDHNGEQKSMIAQREEVKTPMQAPATAPSVSTVRIADSTLPQPTTMSRTNDAALDEHVPAIKEAPVAAAPAKAKEAEVRKDAEPVAATLTKAPEKPAAAPVVVSSRKFEKPLIDQKAPASSTKTADRIEKAPTTSINDMALLSTQGYRAKKGDGVSLGGGRTSNTTTVVDGMATDEDHLKTGDEQFGSGKYGAALKSYRSEMTSGNNKRRSQASVMAARCYINLGQKAKGIELLQQVVESGSGPQRRQAKRLLRDLKGGE